MASGTLLFLAFFASTVSVILSVPQINPLGERPVVVVDAMPNVAADPDPVRPNELNADLVPELRPRTFGDLFNLSAWLAGAPNDSASINFIPLITLLSAKG